MIRQIAVQMDCGFLTRLEDRADGCPTLSLNLQRRFAICSGESVTITGLLYTGSRHGFTKSLRGGVRRWTCVDGAIYHCGPVVLEEEGGWRGDLLAGRRPPSRGNPYMPEIIGAYGVRMNPGQGGWGLNTREACRRQRVRVSAGGWRGGGLAGAAHSARVRAVHLLAEFGATEAFGRSMSKDRRSCDRHPRAQSVRTK